MLHKRQSLIVENRRSVSKFFNRMIEQYERKFDGFPASVADGQMPAMQEGALPIDYGELDISDYLDDETPQCDDTPIEDCVGGDCGGSSTTTALTNVVGSSHGTFKEWEAPLPVDYYVEVWINGLAAIKGTDFAVTESGNIVLAAEFTEEPEVTARFVVA